MTTGSLAAAALPYARTALRNATPQAREAVGPAWLVLWPAWKLVVGPLLPLLVRVAVELGVGLAAPSLLPVLGIVESVFDSTRFPSSAALIADLKQLFQTPTAAMSPPVVYALQTVDLENPE